MRITDKVHKLESTRNAYAYVVCGQETILIDTGFPFVGGRVLKELDQMGGVVESIRHILLTHYDLDHIGNAAMLARVTGAKLWASEVERPYILGETPRPGFKRLLPHIMKVEIPQNLNCCAHGDEIAGIKVISTPGHTPGHVCFLFEDVLFAGDLLESRKDGIVPYPPFWNWNTPMLKDSIKRLKDYPFAWVCPAHGEPVQRDRLRELL